jgi:uncharacterized protein (TIGR00251 family)
VRQPEAPPANAPDLVELTTTGAGVRVLVHAKPRARVSKVVGVHAGALSIAIASPPVDGAANEELVRFLAGLFEAPRTRVSLVRGTSSRLKLVEIEGVVVGDIRRRIDEAVSAATRR